MSILKFSIAVFCLKIETLQDLHIFLGQKDVLKYEKNLVYILPLKNGLFKYIWMFLLTILKHCHSYMFHFLNFLLIRIRVNHRISNWIFTWLYCTILLWVTPSYILSLLWFISSVSKHIAEPIATWFLAFETTMVQIYSNVYQYAQKNSSLAYAMQDIPNVDKPLPTYSFVLHRIFEAVPIPDKLKLVE